MTRPDLPDQSSLTPGRMHEAAGPGRRAFAAVQAGRATGPVLWVIEARRRDTLCPAGLARHLDPARLVIARPSGQLGVLQVMEEALRSGAAPLVIGELDRATDLTQSRRLQLAAGTGGATGLCLLPADELRNNAAETRWLAAPLPGPDGAILARWQVVKTRRGRPGSWDVVLGGSIGPGPATPQGSRIAPASAPARSAAAGELRGGSAG